MANKKLNATITIGGVVASSLKAAFSSTSSQLKGLNSEIKNMERGQRQLGNAIQTFGRMGSNVDGMRARYVRLTSTIDRLRSAQDRLAAAEKRMENARAVRDKLAKAGAISTATGAAIGAPLVVGAKEAKHYEVETARIAALGMGKETNQHAVEFAKSMKTFGTSQLENLELLRDGLSVFADLHHAEMVAPLMAKMKFGNKAVFGAQQGEQNSQQFMDMLKVIETRGGLKSEAEFTKQANIIQQVISATGGRVSATEWRNMLSTGGLAGKSMSSEALFYTMEHMVQEMGGDRAGTGLNSLYKSLYQGVAKKRAVVNLGKLGLIGDTSKVKLDKAGQTASMEPGALLGADLFRDNPFEWMEKVLLPQLAKKGITDERKVIDTMGMIVSNSVGGSFLAEMYRQRENIHRARARNMGAQNIDQLDQEGRNTAEGKQLDAEAKLADLKLRMGSAILPMYSSALETAANAMERLNKFTEDHPALSKAMVIGLGGISVALVALGPVLAIAGTAMTAYAAIQLRTAAASAAAAGNLARETVAIEAQGAAAASAGGKLLAFAKSRLGILALANIGDMAAGAFGVGKDKADQGLDDANWSRMNWWQKGQSGLLRGIEHTGRFIGMGNMADQAQADRVKAETDYLNKNGPALPSMATARQAAPTINDNSQTTLQIYQQPGQSQDELANAIIRKMKEQQGVRNRSIMYDNP
jgi:exonuclease VII small subunit